MKTLHPRNVGPGAWKRWLREALALSRRSLLPNVLSGIACVGLLIAASYPGNQTLFIGSVLSVPITALVWFIRTAHHGDRSLPLSISFRTSFQRLASVALAITTPYVAFLFAYTVLLFIAQIVSLTDRSETQLPSAMPSMSFWYALSMLILIATNCWIFCTALLRSWFVLPLVIFHDLSFLTAWRLSFEADGINNGSCWSVSVGVMVVLALLVLTTNIVAFIVALPILGALMYVSYRDVFLGRAENLPIATSGLRYATEQ